LLSHEGSWSHNNSTTAQDTVSPSLGHLVKYVKLAKRNEKTGTLTVEMLKA